MSVYHLLALAAKPVWLAKKLGPALFVSLGVLLWMHLLIPVWFPRLVPGFARLFSDSYAKLLQFVGNHFDHFSGTSIEPEYAAEVQRLHDAVETQRRHNAAEIQTLHEAVARNDSSTESLESRLSRVEEALERYSNHVAICNSTVGSSPSSVIPTTTAAATTSNPTADTVVAAGRSSAVDAPAAAPDNDDDDDGGDNGNVIERRPSAAERALALLSRSHELHGTQYYSNDGFVSIQAFLDKHHSTLDGKRMRFACRIVPPMTRYKTNFVKVILQVSMDTHISMRIDRRTSSMDWDELDRAMATETCYLLERVVRSSIGKAPCLKFDDQSLLCVLPSYRGCCLETISKFYDEMDADYNNSR